MKITPLLLPVMVGLACALCARAQTPADAAVDALAERGAALRDFGASVHLTLAENDTGLMTGYAGDFWFQNATANQGPRVRMTVELEHAGETERPQKKDISLAGTWICMRDYGTATQTRRQIAAKGQSVDLMALGDGLFPLPFGRSKAEIHRDFTVKPVDSAADDPPHTVHVELTPRSGTRAAGAVAVVGIWIDQATHVPARIDAINANKTREITADFAARTVDHGLEADAFKLAPLHDWTIQPDQPFKP